MLYEFIISISVFNIFFLLLIMNIDCEKIIKQFNDSEYEFAPNFSKDYINAINSDIFV